MNIDFGKTNSPHFYPLFYNQRRHLVLCGGAGSGKSHFTAQKLICRVLAEPIDHKFLVIRKTTPAVRESAFSLVCNYLDKWEIPHRVTDLKVRFNDSQMLFKGLDDPEKIKSIEGVTGIWVEEASELGPRDYRQLNLRLRGDIGTYKQIVSSFNPIGGKLSWLYKKFFEKETPDTHIDRSTWRDNKFIDEGYYDLAIKTDDSAFMAIYDKGEWAELKNRIIQNYVVRHFTSKQVIEVLNRADRVYAGVDFGFNDPCVFLLVAEVDRVVYVLREYYKTGILNSRFVVEVKGILGKINCERKLLNIQMFADSAEPDRILEFVQGGLQCYKANKKVKEGLEELRRRKYIINDECVNTCQEIPVYSYREDKNGNVLEEPVEYNDHTPAALRYAVFTSSKMGGIQLFTGSSRKRK